jgi:hypothetical protein
MGWTGCPGGRDDNYVQNFGVKRGRKPPRGNGDHRRTVCVREVIERYGFGVWSASACPAIVHLCRGLFSYCYVVFCVLFVVCFTTLVYYLTAIGLTPGDSNTAHIYTQTVHRILRAEHV